MYSNQDIIDAIADKKMNDFAKIGKIKNLLEIEKNKNNLQEALGYFDEEGDTPLTTAVIYDVPDIVQLLVDFGADVNLPNNQTGNSPFLSASEMNAIDVARVLLKNNANVEASDDEGYTALMKAAMNNNVEMIDFLVNDAKVDVNKTNRNNGHNALMVAIYYKSQEAIEKLVQLNANINARDHLGIEPLAHAILANNYATAQSLVKLGVNVDSQDNNGMTPLMNAAETQGGNVFLQLLLENKAIIDLKNNAGDTALAFAVINELPLNVRILKLAGANENIQNNNGDTPLTLAKNLHDKSTLMALIEKKPVCEC